MKREEPVAEAWGLGLGCSPLIKIGREPNWRRKKNLVPKLLSPRLRREIEGGGGPPGGGGPGPFGAKKDS